MRPDDEPLFGMYIGFEKSRSANYLARIALGELQWEAEFGHEQQTKGVVCGWDSSTTVDALLERAGDEPVRAWGVREKS